MQQHVHYDRDDDRKSQRESLSSARAGNQSAKGRVNRICQILYELEESGAFARREQFQQKPDREKAVDEKENIIDDL